MVSFRPRESLQPTRFPVGVVDEADRQPSIVRFFDEPVQFVVPSTDHRAITARYRDQVSVCVVSESYARPLGWNEVRGRSPCGPTSQRIWVRPTVIVFSRSPSSYSQTTRCPKRSVISWSLPDSS